MTDIEHERRRAKSEVPFISTSGVSASTLSTGDEYWQPMDPIYYYNKSTCFRPILTRCPIFKNRVTIGRTEPRLDLFKNELPPIKMCWMRVLFWITHPTRLKQADPHAKCQLISADCCCCCMIIYLITNIIHIKKSFFVDYFFLHHGKKLYFVDIMHEFVIILCLFVVSLKNLLIRFNCHYT